MHFEASLQALQAEVDILEKVVILVAGTLGDPVLRQINSDRGYRYEKPNIRHFCVLKAIRVVSALNASIVLARAGYTQEIGVLLRTLAEFTTHIDFVLDPAPSEAHKSKVEQYIIAFFGDTRRDPEAEIKKAQIPQGVIHSLIGKTLDNINQEERSTQDRAPAASLYSNIYRIFSNYVHGKYPEVMDLFGGRPGRYHLRGMRGTPKDLENLAMIEALITSARNTLAGMIQTLQMRQLLEQDKELANWYLKAAGAS